jgi:hypothetical protein
MHAYRLAPLLCLAALACLAVACQDAAPSDTPSSSDAPQGAPSRPLVYDPSGLPSCSRLSALTAWQGSCDDGEACAFAPEMGGGVCAPGCDTDADCPEGSACRYTDDQGWARWWCAPRIPGPL